MTTASSESADGYERFFGLHEAPFSLAPNPRFLYESASHSAALAQVAYAIERREPLVVLTGEIGTGKTLLCRTVLQRLGRKTFLSVVGDPLLERDELLRLLLQDFGVISKDRARQGNASRHELIIALQAFLRSLLPLEAHAVVIIDEAQHLRPDVLEQIRLLSNVDDEHGTALQMILVGQTDLEPLLSRPELRQLQQRISRRLQLNPLSQSEVHQYVEHRLARARNGTAVSPSATLADGSGNRGTSQQHPERVFTLDAIHGIAAISGGLPRVINLVCDRSMEAAYAARRRTIDVEFINIVAESLALPARPVPRPAADLATPWRSSTAADDSFDAATSFEWGELGAFGEPVDESRSDAAPVPRSPRAPSATAVEARPRRMKFAGLAALGAIVAAVLVWAAVRAVRPVAPPASVAQTAARTAGPAAAPIAAASPAAHGASVADQPRARSAGVERSTTDVPARGAGLSTMAKPLGPVPAANEHVDIVVASFKTEARASSVAAAVAALGLPVRQRATESWQQVIVGPFTSRTGAHDAQQQLDRAGLTGTQIVAAVP